MRAAVFDAFNDPLRIATRPDPAPAPGEVLIRTRSCGICGSDLHLAAGESGLVVEPGCIFGHEFAGDVVARGAEVRDFAVGDRVVVLPVLGCGSCRAWGRCCRTPGCPSSGSRRPRRRRRRSSACR